MISLEHVSKTFSSTAGNVHAVKDVTLHIKDGEIFGIIGFSGAGKSTLVRCINLLERPTEGKVLVADDDLMSLSAKELREVRKKIGMIFQHFNLMKSRTVYQNIAFPLKDSKLSKEEKDKKILSLLELVDLKEKKDAYPSQLSGGQKQRVAIARALAMEPEVLLCDEPTSALDPEMTTEVLKVLKGLSHTGLTMIVVTHEMNFAKEVADYILYMDKGQIVECSTPEEFFTNAKTERARQFISNML